MILKDGGSIRRIVNGVAFHNTYSLGSQYDRSTTESQIRDYISDFKSVIKLDELCDKLQEIESDIKKSNKDKSYNEKKVSRVQDKSSEAAVKYQQAIQKLVRERFEPQNNND